MADKPLEHADDDQPDKADHAPGFLSGPRGVWVAIVAAIAFALVGCFGPLVWREANRQAVINRIQHQGRVDYGFGTQHRLVILNSLLPDHFRDVHEIVLGDMTLFDQSKSQPAEFDFSSLACFPELKSLCISKEYQAEQLQKLPRLENLEELTLISEHQTDAVVEHLATACPRLKRLVIFSPAATEASIDSISRLEELERLHLERTAIDAQALLKLRTLKHLIELCFEDTTGPLTGAKMHQFEGVLPMKWGRSEKSGKEVVVRKRYPRGPVPSGNTETIISVPAAAEDDKRENDASK